MAKAGLLGFDRDEYLAERDPAKQVLTAALIDEADRVRADWMEELAVRTIAALGRSMPN